MYNEEIDFFKKVASRKDISVILIKANGKHFSAGIDIGYLMKQEMKEVKIKDTARKGNTIINNIKYLQKSTNLIQNCPQIVISLIDGACVGMGIDFITATDIRLSTKNAQFCIAEINMGLCPDVGTMARLPKIIGNQSLFRELALSGRMFNGNEALKFGLVSNIYNTKEELYKNGEKLANLIASKSPIALFGIKKLSNYALDHTINDTQDYITSWNAWALQTIDVKEAATAFLQKRKPKFSKL